MSLPVIEMYNADGTFPAAPIVFQPRPLGGTSNAERISVWNGRPQTEIKKSLGIADGTKSVFTTVHKGLVGASLVEVYLDTEEAPEGDYSVDRANGTITFPPGKIPAAGKEVFATYTHAQGAGATSSVFLLSRRHHTVTYAGDASIILPTKATRIYEVLVNGVFLPEAWYMHEDGILSLQTGSFEIATGDKVEIIYEDEACTQQVLQARVSGFLDPYGVGASVSAGVSYLPLGGTVREEDVEIGTWNPDTLVHSLGFPCVLLSDMIIRCGTVSIDYVLDPVLGEVELTPPVETIESGTPILASFSRYKAMEVPPILPGTGITLSIRGHVPTTATERQANASLEIWAV